MKGLFLFVFFWIFFIIRNMRVKHYLGILFGFLPAFGLSTGSGSEDVIIRSQPIELPLRKTASKRIGLRRFPNVTENDPICSAHPAISTIST